MCHIPCSIGSKLFDIFTWKFPKRRLPDSFFSLPLYSVYQKWNERLFCEMTEAYRAGRMSTDPATFWYQGEIGFLENYVIPLAKKLKDCNVFGVSSDEYLSYALANKEEWEQKGQQIVAELVEKAQYSILEEDENDLDNSEEVSYDNLH